jgi:hypothetical protein
VTAPDRRESDRAFVTGVLSGAISPESHDWAFADDIVLICVRRVERADPQWLLAQLADRGYPFEGRAAVAAETRDVRDAALAVLRTEQPDFLD